MVRAGDWVLEQMSIYIFKIGPEVPVYIGVWMRVGVCVGVGNRYHVIEKAMGGGESG